MLVCFALEQLLSFIVSDSGGLQCPQSEPQKCSLEQMASLLPPQESSFSAACRAL